MQTAAPQGFPALAERSLPARFPESSWKESGEHVDPFHNQPVSWERPENILESMRSWRWRLSVLGLLSVPDDSHRRIVLGNAMGHYLCRVWNAEHTGGERLRLGRYARVVEPIGRHSLKKTYREWIGKFDCRDTT